MPSRSRGVGVIPRWLLLLFILTCLLITNLNIPRTHAQDEAATAEIADPVDPSVAEADTPATTATDTDPAAAPAPATDSGAVPEGHSGDDEMPAPAPAPAPAPDAQSDAQSDAQAEPEAESGSTPQFDTIPEPESTPAPVTVTVRPTSAAKRKVPTSAPAPASGKGAGSGSGSGKSKATKAPATKVTKPGKGRATKPPPGAGAGAGAGKAGWKGRRPIKVFPTNPDPAAHGKPTTGWIPGRAGAGPPLFPHSISDDVPANVSYHVNIGTIPDGANIINDDKPIWIDPDDTPNMSSKKKRDGSDGERHVVPPLVPAPAPAPGQFIVPEDINFADFYVSRLAFPDDLSNNRSISLQQPFIFADFVSINAYVTAWGHTKFIQPIPLRSQAITEVTPDQVSAVQRSNDTNSDNLIFTVQFECKVKVASRIRLTVKARLYETTQGHRSRKIVTFQFWKDCPALEVPIAGDGTTAAAAAPGSGSASASASDGTSIPGFSIGLSPGGDEVVRHGTAQDGFGSRSRTPKLGITTKAPEMPGFDDDDEGGMQQAQDTISPTKPTQTIYTINETTSTLYLYVRYQRKTTLTISRPFIFAHRPDIVMGEVGGPLTLTAKTTLRPYVTYLLAITLSCKANTASSSLVTVAFKFPDDARLSVSFTFSKSCAGIQIADGIAGSGVNVGYARSWNDVVNDGVTQPYWSKVNKEDDQKQTDPRVVFLPDQTNATFVISLRAGYPPVSYLPPLVSSYTPDGVVAARPTVCGSLTEQKQLTSDEKLALNVEFNCVRKKTVSITVSIPLRPSGSLDWVMHKICDADPEVAVEQPTDLSPVPGLNVGLQPHAHGIAVDGIPNANYTWTNSISTLATFVKATFGTVCFSKAKDAVDDIYLGTPELTSTLEIAKPVLSGMSDHEVISSDHSVCLRITFNCYLQGSTMFTLMVPIEAPENEQPPRAEPFIISFMKKCPAPGEESDADVVQAWAGGVDIHGFYIGTGPTKSDVVKDGFPTKYYYGQRIKKNPQWDSIMVPANVSSIRLFLRYATPQTKSSAENDLDLWDRVAFQDPYIIAHTIQAKPELSGEAATEGALQLDADPLELDVTFNCVYQGVAVTTIMLPVHPLGTITFTIPKMCEGADPPRGVRISGLNIGTSPDTSDVVKDGFTSEKYLSWSTEDKNAYHSDKEVERFWVSHSDQGEAQINATALRGRDPIVYCVRNTCRASLNHSLHASDADSEIVITSTPSPIDVLITCLLPYPSVVTIKIPILPVGMVAFTWITSCKTDNNGEGEGSAIARISYPDDPNFRGRDPSVDSADEEMTHASGEMEFGQVDEFRGGPHQHVDAEENQDYSWMNVRVDVGTGGIVENDPNSLNEDPIDQMLLDDVISRDIPRPRYAQIRGADSKSDEVIDSSGSAIVRSAVSTFFITPQGGNQKYLSAQVMIRGRNICEPKFIGDFGIEKGEMQEGRHSVMHLQYNCLTAGMSTILISIPLEPKERGHLSWRVVKLCPATTPKVIESQWTITNIMYTIAMMTAATFAVGGCLYYKKIKQLADVQQYAPVSTKPTMSKGDVEMDVAESSRPNKHADFISDSE